MDVSSQESGWGRGGAAALAVAGLVVFHGCVNGWWLGADGHPVHGAEAAQVSQSLLMGEVLKGGGAAGISERAWLLGQLEGAQPPLLALAGALAVVLGGAQVDVAAAANTVFFLVLIVGVYLLARGLGGGRGGGALAAGAVGLMPLVAGASRLMIPEVGTAAVLVLFLWALGKSEGFRRIGWSAAAGGLAGLGLLTDLSFVVWLPGALVVALGVCGVLSTREGGPVGRLRWGHVALFLLISFSVAGTWYFHNARSLLTGDEGPLRNLPATYLALGDYEPPEEFGVQPALPEPVLPKEIQAEAALVAPTSPRPAAKAVARPRAWSAYVRQVVETGLVVPCVLGLAGLVVLLARGSGRRCAVGLAGASGVGGLCLLGLRGPAAAEQLIPLAGLCAALFGAGLWQVRWGGVRWAVAGVYLVFAGVQFVQVTVSPVLGDRGWAPAVLLRERAYAMGPPWRGGNIYAFSFSAIAGDAGDAGFVTMQAINATGFRVLAAAYWPERGSGRAVVVPLDPEYFSEPEQLDAMDRLAEYYVLVLSEGMGAEIPERWREALRRHGAEVVTVIPSARYGELPEARVVVFRARPPESGMG